MQPPSKEGPLVGQQGVKYGLQKPVALSKKPAAAAVKPVNVFGDDDSDEDVEAEIARQAEKKRSAAKVQQMYESALAEDPSVFDYDGVYDSIQAARTQPKQQEKLARQSKYIAQLKEQAESRKRVEDIRFERRLLKERVAEDALFDDKEKFVTSAYRKKLEENQKWVEAQRLKDEEDEKQDVRKVGHLGNFYSNLLTKNVAMGTAVASDGKKTASASPEPEPQPVVVAPAKQGPVLDKYEQLRMAAEAARKQQVQGEASAQGQGEGAEEQPAGASKVEVGQGSDAGAPAEPADGGQAAAAAATAGGKKRNDEEAVMSARERYLARKRTKTEGGP